MSLPKRKIRLSERRKQDLHATRLRVANLKKPSLLSSVMSLIDNPIVEEVVDDLGGSQIFNKITDSMQALSNTLGDLQDDIKGGQKLLDEEESKLLELTQNSEELDPISFVDIEARRHSLEQHGGVPETQEPNDTKEDDQKHMPDNDPRELPPSTDTIIVTPLEEIPLTLPPPLMRRGNVLVAETNLSELPNVVHIPMPTIPVDAPAKPPVKRPVIQKAVIQKAVAKNRELTSGKKKTLENIQRIKKK